MSNLLRYECRANHKATFEDISPILLEDYPRKTGSKLAKQVRERGIEETSGDMQLLVGSPEHRYIQNVAIMMFGEHPEKFFEYTYVQMTSFSKGSIENPAISKAFPNIMGSVPQIFAFMKYVMYNIHKEQIKERCYYEGIKEKMVIWNGCSVDGLINGICVW